jgi:acetolactate synthase small subunit
VNVLIQGIDVGDESIMVLARNRAGVLAKITTLLAHRQVNLLAMMVSCEEGSETMCMLLTIRPKAPGDIEMLQRRLNRVVDVVQTVTLT